MTEAELYAWATYAELALALATVVALTFVTAPYGRHTRAGFGPGVPVRLGWVLMELPAVVVWAGIFALGQNALSAGPLLLLAMWQLHYVQRTFVFPLRMPASNKTTPILVVVLAILFNVLNAYVNARWVSHFGAYPLESLHRPSFFLGVGLFLIGWAINIQTDGALLALRKQTGGGYAIPKGGLFRWVSCPNYLGELCEWLGWALATWSLAGLAFALYTAANLVPRAIAHHRWYLAKFPDYPPERKALVPLLW